MTHKPTICSAKLVFPFATGLPGKRSRLAIAFLVGLLTATLTFAAQAATSGLTLRLLASHGDRTLVACRLRHHYALYRRGQPIRITGLKQPRPGHAWQVKVKIKRCTDGRFTTVWTVRAAGRSDGAFSVSYLPRGAGAFFARAYDESTTPTRTSDKRYFSVR